MAEYKKLKCLSIIIEMQRDTIAWTPKFSSYIMQKYELSPHSLSPKTKPQHLYKDSLYVSLSKHISFCCSLARLAIVDWTWTRMAISRNGLDFI